MSFRNFNLNLLLVFEAMLDHRSTTKAGRALGLTQSAVSNSLAQLRAALNDPLFTRSRHEMMPTARALELAQPVSAALRELRAAVEGTAAFDPSRSSRVFRLGMSDYSAYVMLDRIVAAARAQAGNLRITVRSVDPNESHVAVQNDEVDACIGFAEHCGGGLRSTPLFEDHWVCARRAEGSGRPNAITLEEYLGARHVVIGNGLNNHIDRLLARQGIARENTVSLPFCLAAPLLIEGTDLLLTLPRRIAEQFKQGRRISIGELPFRSRGFPVILLWHERSEHDPAQRWMRTLIADASSSFRGSAAEAQRPALPAEWRAEPAAHDARIRASAATQHAAATR